MKGRLVQTLYTQLLCRRFKSKSAMDKAALDARMKSYELETYLTREQSFVVRLDGRKFSTYLRPFPKFDPLLHEVLVKTAVDLHREFHPNLIARHSDEISLVFYADNLGTDTDQLTQVPQVAATTSKDATFRLPGGVADLAMATSKIADDKPALPFDGRVSKFLSLIPSLATACFNKHIREAPYKDALKAHIDNSTPVFDARLVILPHSHEIFNYIFFRNGMDCYRNSIDMWARQYLSSKELEGLGRHKSKELVLSKVGVRYEDEVPMYLRHGVFIKRFTGVTASQVGEDTRNTRSVTLAFTLDLNNVALRQRQIEFLLMPERPATELVQTLAEYDFVQEYKQF